MMDFRYFDLFLWIISMRNESALELMLKLD